MTSVTDYAIWSAAYPRWDWIIIGEAVLMPHRYKHICESLYDRLTHHPEKYTEI